MPRRTIKDVCEQHGITRAVLNCAVNEGVNKWNDDEMRYWLAGRRTRSDSKSPAPGIETPEVPEGGEAMTLDELEEALSAARDPREATMRKTQISGMREVVKIRQDLNQLVAIGEVRERDTRIASAVRLACIKMENDLPPKGVGLDEAGMQKAFRPVIRNILEMLADDQSDFWRDKE